MSGKFPSCSTLVTSLNESSKLGTATPETGSLCNPRTTRQLLQKKYDTSHNYYFLNTIDAALKKKNSVKWVIDIHDLQANDSQQHMETYFYQQQLLEEIPSLIEYYRYYGQGALVYFGKYFKMMAGYLERHRVLEYRRLKKILSLESDTEQETHSTVGKNLDPNFNGTRLLKDMTNSLYPPSESDYFNDLQHYMSRFLGTQQPLSLRAIDAQYEGSQPVHGLRSLLNQHFSNPLTPRNPKNKKMKRLKSAQKTSLNEKQKQKNSPFKRKTHNKNNSAVCVRLNDSVSQIINVIQRQRASNNLTKSKNDKKRDKDCRVRRNNSAQSIKQQKLRRNQKTQKRSIGIKIKNGCLKNDGNRLKQNISIGAVKDQIASIKRKIRKQKLKIISQI